MHGNLTVFKLIFFLRWHGSNRVLDWRCNAKLIVELPNHTQLFPILKSSPPIDSWREDHRWYGYVAGDPLSLIVQISLSGSIHLLAPDSAAMAPTVSKTDNNRSLLSSLDSLSFFIRLTNFKHLVSIIRPVFWFQYQVEEIHTRSGKNAYLDCRLFIHLCVPFLLLFWLTFLSSFKGQLPKTLSLLCSSIRRLYARQRVLCYGKLITELNGNDISLSLFFKFSLSSPDPELKREWTYAISSPPTSTISVWHSNHMRGSISAIIFNPQRNLCPSSFHPHYPLHILPTSKLLLLLVRWIRSHYRRRVLWMTGYYSPCCAATTHCWRALLLGRWRRWIHHRAGLRWVSRCWDVRGCR